MRDRKQIEAAAGAYYRINEAKNRNISTAALKSFKDGIKWADENPACPWRSVLEPPKEPGMVFVWCVDDDGHETALMASYKEGYFDLLGVLFWIPTLWMPIPAVPEELKNKLFEV